MNSKRNSESDSASWPIAFGNIWQSGQYVRADEESRTTWDNDVQALGQDYLDASTPQPKRQCG